MQATPTQVQRSVGRREPARDWIAWYEDLAEAERREIRARLLTASYDEVKSDAELRNYFFFHSEDVAHERPPGGERVAEIHAVLSHLRGNDDPSTVEQRRKAVAFLLAEYQAFLRDNPWA